MRYVPPKSYFWRNTLYSLIGHVLIIILLLIASLASCVKRRKPHEITTFVELQPAVQAEMTQVEAGMVEAEPEPAPELIPDPPKPVPEPPKPKPEPPKPKKHQVEVSKKIVTRTAQTKTNLAPPALNASQIKQQLNRGMPAQTLSASAHSGDTAFALYLSRVRDIMYRAWDQPGSLAGQKGITSQVRLRVLQNGKITQRALTRSSGNALMDQSVIRAAESVFSLPELPPGFGGDYKDITVDFELTD